MGGAEWQDAVRLIEAARGPADLFDTGDAGDTGDAARRYRRLARLTHPDSSPDRARTSRAFEKLAALWTQYQNASATPLASGDIANLYRTNDGALKLTRDPADNDLIEREAVALTLLRARGDTRFRAYVPRLLRGERQRDPDTGVVRRASVLGWLDGFVSLADVQDAYPGGLDPRDAAWMWRRLLVALGFAHRAGVIHGAVLPPHVMIHPAEHGLALVDWCYSAGPSGPGPLIPAVVERYRDWYPGEVFAREEPSPATDIYLAARCLTELMDGSAAPLAAFARGCLLRQPSRRPQDAWRLLTELDEHLERLYGPRTFRPFTMPIQR
jgi:hypothetical protein